MYEYITKTMKLLSKDYFCVIVSKRLEHTDNVNMLLKMKTTQLVWLHNITMVTQLLKLKIIKIILDP